jgi:signal recognition particle receptor subunit beta
MAEQGYDLDKLPFTIQYNKRDLPNVAPVENMNRLLNANGIPSFDAVAVTGAGVFETLKNVARQVLIELKKHY